jgi:hypothetical protein
MSCSCTRPPELGRSAAGGSPRAAGARVPPVRLTPNFLGQGHAPTDSAPGRRCSDLEIRVASPVAAGGRTGNLTALNLHLLFLLRGSGEIPRRRRWSYLLKGKEGISGRLRTVDYILTRLSRGLKPRFFHEWWPFQFA